MNKNFWFGTLFGIGLFCCMGALSPVYVTHSSTTQTDSEFRNAYAVLQPQQMDILYSSPSIGNLQQRQPFILKTGDMKIAFRSNNWLFYVKVSS